MEINKGKSRSKINEIKELLNWSIGIEIWFNQVKLFFNKKVIHKEIWLLEKVDEE